MRVPFSSSLFFTVPLPRLVLVLIRAPYSSFRYRNGNTTRHRTLCAREAVQPKVEVLRWWYNGNSTRRSIPPEASSDGATAPVVARASRWTKSCMCCARDCGRRARELSIEPAVELRELPIGTGHGHGEQCGRCGCVAYRLLLAAPHPRLARHTPQSPARRLNAWVSRLSVRRILWVGGVLSVEVLADGGAKGQGDSDSSRKLRRKNQMRDSQVLTRGRGRSGEGDVAGPGGAGREPERVRKQDPSPRLVSFANTQRWSQRRAVGHCGENMWTVLSTKSRLSARGIPSDGVNDERLQATRLERGRQWERGKGKAGQDTEWVEEVDLHRLCEGLDVNLRDERRLRRGQRPTACRSRRFPGDFHVLRWSGCRVVTEDEGAMKNTGGGRPNCGGQEYIVYANEEMRRRCNLKRAGFIERSGIQPLRGETAKQKPLSAALLVNVFAKALVLEPLLSSLPMQGVEIGSVPHRAHTPYMLSDAVAIGLRDVGYGQGGTVPREKYPRPISDVNWA
ncbi:hypothetical protein C8R45DRAFT_1138867 [Mycena sanguinolenta]|nr:hypothetical protein C8R45DRAFT_1138867 [Mycena sanguinolenta]